MEIHLRTVVVDCEDAHRAAHFYSKLLGWPITLRSRTGCSCGTPGGNGLSFQTEEGLRLVLWPAPPPEGFSKP